MKPVILPFRRPIILRGAPLAKKNPKYAPPKENSRNAKRTVQCENAVRG